MLCGLILIMALYPSTTLAFTMTSTLAFTTTQPRSSLLQRRMSEPFEQETPEKTKTRIDEMIKANPVMLFMKGNKMFPQCGFSNTAVQILSTYNIDFETCDVLADEAIRSGIKDYSSWPTIPQLYVAGEFIGGCDIMIEEYQNGNLGETIEKAKADM